MAIKKLWLTGTGITDLSPLKGMPLEFVSVSSNMKVSDLSPLRGMPLVELRMHDSAGITDLSPLKESKSLRLIVIPPNAKGFEFLRTFPKLERVSYRDDPKNGFRPDMTAAEFWTEYDQAWLRALRATGVSIKAVTQLPDQSWSLDLINAKGFRDLSLLKGAPVSRLYLGRTGVSDLAPLRGMPLKRLYLDGDDVTDIAPLQGMPLEELSLRETKVTDLSVLRGMPLVKLDISQTGVADLRPLEGTRLNELTVRDTRVTDLTPLRAPALSSGLRTLDASMLKATDFSPLAACASLEELTAFGNPGLSDLAFLRGRKLRLLWVANSPVSDISPVAGMPLTIAYLDKTRVTDVSPLLRCPTLQSIMLPADARDVSALRALPALERISYEYTVGTGPSHTAAEFWNQLGRSRASAHVRAGRSAEGRKAYGEAIRLHPDDHWSWFELAVLLARDGDAAACRAHCHAMLDRFGTTADPTVMERTAKSCLLLPIDDADRAAAVRLAEAAATHEEDTLIAWFRFVQGLARYRAGEYARAADALARVDDGGYALLGLPATAVLAMSQHRLGRTAEARALLKDAEARAADNLPKPGVDPGEPWRDVFIARMLLREARELIGE